MTPQKIILGIIKPIISRMIPESEIYLFGSRARDENIENSDFDLLIISKNEYLPSEKAKILSNLRLELARKGVPADLILNSKTEAQNNRQLPGHIVHEAFKEMIAI